MPGRKFRSLRMHGLYGSHLTYVGTDCAYCNIIIIMACCDQFLKRSRSAFNILRDALNYEVKVPERTDFESRGLDEVLHVLFCCFPLPSIPGSAWHAGAIVLGPTLLSWPWLCIE